MGETTGSTDGDDDIEAAVAAYRNRVLDEVKNVLARLPDERLQRLTYDVAFAPNDVLPKRADRPRLAASFYAERVYESLADDDAHVAEVLQLGMVFQEYFDVFDDVMDGDVPAENVPTAVAVGEVLVALTVQILADLPEGAAKYWSERAVDLKTALAIEVTEEPSREVYREMLDRQSNYYGAVTGVAAVAAGADEEAVERAEELGRLAYRLDQGQLDRIQYEGGDGDDPDETWNLRAFYDDEEFAELLGEWRDRFEEIVETFPPEQRPLLRAPIDGYEDRPGALNLT